MLRAASLLVVLALCTAPQAWAQVTLTQGADQIAVAIDGKPFTVFYIGGANLNRPYLHPLRTASGKIVNRSFPAGQLAGETTDHPHHYGLFYGHGDVNGFNYWAVQSVASPQPAASANFGRIVLMKPPVVKSGKDSGAVDVVLTWLKPDGVPLLTETRQMTFYAHPEPRIIDFDFDFAAIDTVVFRDTKEGLRDAHGHRARRAAGQAEGGRVRENRQADQRAGRRGRTWRLGKRSEWVDYSGVLDGERVGVVMMDHPGNPRHPTYWHSRGYGLHSINPFGVSDFLNDKTQNGSLTIAPGQHVRFRYRVVIHPGVPPSKLADLYREFAGTRR